MSGYTQNVNESLTTIWRLAPKHLNCNAKILEITAFIATGIFNKGYSAVLKIINELEINIGPECKHYIKFNEEVEGLLCASGIVD